MKNINRYTLDGLTNQEKKELMDSWNDRVENPDNTLILFRNWMEVFCWKYGLKKSTEISQSDVKSMGYSSKREMVENDVENNNGFHLELSTGRILVLDGCDW